MWLPVAPSYSQHVSIPAVALEIFAILLIFAIPIAIDVVVAIFPTGTRYIFPCSDTLEVETQHSRRRMVHDTVMMSRHDIIKEFRASDISTRVSLTSRTFLPLMVTS